MSDDWREEWVGSKVTLAKKLNAGECEGGYAEAAIILCGVISAVASERWPGRNKDRKRFVEVLHRYADANLYATRVSIPLLIAYLGGEGRSTEQRELRDAFMPHSDSRVITGDDVDRSDIEITKLCPSLTLSLVRRFSYAALLYEETRSSYAHEYMPGPRSDSWAMGSARAHASVSYINWLDMNQHNSHVRHLIYFSVQWLADLAASVERNIRPLSPNDSFSTWWLRP